jgi:hypothetical protein
VGFQALETNTTGSSNTALGRDSLIANTTGTDNTASGYQALYSNTTGNHNTASGRKSLRLNSTGIHNTASGSEAMYSNTTGTDNTAHGYQALYNNTTGTLNTAVGFQALKSNVVHNYNTAIGDRCLGNATEHYNTAIGALAGWEVTSGERNILIGMNAGRTASPSGSITTGDNIICLGDNYATALYCADTSISSSDGRDKADVENFTTGLSFVNQMRPVTYRWDKRSWYTGDNPTPQDILDAVPDGTHKKTKQNIGFISQEVQALEQEIGFSTSKDNELICNTNADDTAMGLKYERLVPVLVNAIQELSAENKALTARLEALENA